MLLVEMMYGLLHAGDGWHRTLRFEKFLLLFNRLSVLKRRREHGIVSTEFRKHRDYCDVRYGDQNVNADDRAGCTMMMHFSRSVDESGAIKSAGNNTGFFSATFIVGQGL